MCVSAPVVEGGELLAVLTVYSPFAFSETNQMLIEAIARELPLAIESGRRTQLHAEVTK